MREFVSVNTDGVKTSRRCPGEPASPGFLVLCLLLFSFIGTAVASELFPEGEGLRTAPELSVSATAQPILRILYISVFLFLAFILESE